MKRAGVSGWEYPGWISITLPISHGQIIQNYRGYRFNSTEQGTACFKKSAAKLVEISEGALTVFSISGKGIGHTFLPPSVARDFLLEHGSKMTKEAMLKVN